MSRAFDTDGKVLTHFGFGNDYAYGVVIEPDGKIVAAGRAYNGANDDFALACYNPNGSLYTPFGTSGKVLSDFASSSGSQPLSGWDGAQAIALVPGEKVLSGGLDSLDLVVAGQVWTDQYDFAAVRYFSPSGGLPVQVPNVAPTLTPADPQTVLVGQSFTITDLGTFTDTGFDNPYADPETYETFTYTIDWGDESLPDTGAATIDTPGSPGQPTEGSFDGTHTYAQTGDYTVTITLSDDDDGEDTENVQVTVNPFTGADVSANEFSADGHSLVVDYDVSGVDIPLLSIGIYQSLDGVTPETRLQTYWVTDPADLQVGTGHQVSITPEFPGIQDDCFLIAVLDPDGNLAEPNEADNEAPFEGGVFLTLGGTLYVQGTAAVDTLDISFTTTIVATFNSTPPYSYAPEDVFEIRAFMHEGNDNVTAGSEVDCSLYVLGGPGNDAITAGGGMDVLDGGPGADTIHGGSGGDFIDGGDGDDTLYGEDGGDTIYGGAGSDVIYAGADDDYVYAEAGNDIVVGGLGDDEIYGGDGDDDLSGNEGYDEIHGEGGNNTLRGGADDDWLEGGDLVDIIYGGDGDDFLDGVAGDDELYGELGKDVMYSRQGNDRIEGGDGDDTLYCGEGNDTAVGGYGNDEIYGEDGADDLSGNEGSDIILGGPGANTIHGGDGDDRLEGGDLADFIYGGPGDDFIAGGDGDDHLYGDAGADVIHAGLGDDYADGGDDGDMIYGDEGIDTLLGGGWYDWIEGGDGNDTLSGGALNDILLGNAGDDVLYGDQQQSTDNGHDVLVGGEGADSLYAGVGSAELYGGPGEDTLYGNSGYDTLRGGDGDDVLYGGGGNDDLDGEDGTDTLFGGDGYNDPMYVDANPQGQYWNYYTDGGYGDTYAVSATEQYRPLYTWNVSGATYPPYQEVFVTWVPGGDRGTAVPYNVHHAEGQSDAITVNQQNQPPGSVPDDPLKWQSLGVYEAAESVEVNGHNPSPYPRTCVDAVLLRGIDPTCDLLTDSNNDGSINADDDPVEGDPTGSMSAGPGRIVAIGASERTEVKLHAAAVDAVLSGPQQWTAYLRFPSALKVWTAAVGGSELTTNTEWNITTQGPWETSVWIEGLTAGTANLHLELFSRPGDPEEQRWYSWKESVKFTNVALTDFTVEVKEWSGTWTQLGPEEGILSDEAQRWTALDVLTALKAAAVSVEWWAAPWPANEHVPPSQWATKEVFAVGGPHGVAEATLPVGDWVITPAFCLADGSKVTMAEGEHKQRTLCKEVCWEGYDPGDGKTNFEANGNPVEFGGGDRVFAERNIPQGPRAGDELHDIVQVSVTLDPAPTQDYRVWLRVLDPDHYSQDPEFDPGGSDNPATQLLIERDQTGMKPNDNLRGTDIGRQIGEVGAVLPNPLDSYLDFAKGGPATKELGMRIYNRQPGNNFVVVQMAEKSFLQYAAFADDGKTPVVKLSSRDVRDVPEGSKTHILTVWRTLRAEIDSMGTPNLLQEPYPSIIASGNITRDVENPRRFTISTSIGALGTDQFQEGRITLLDAAGQPVTFRDAEGQPITVRSRWGEILPAGTCEVEFNTAGQGGTVLTVNANVPEEATQFKDLFDDDLRHNVTADKMVPDPAMWDKVFKPACVKVDLTRHDLSNANADPVDQSDVPFKLNVGTHPKLDNGSWQDEDQVEFMNAGRQQSSPQVDFWVIYQLGAFQGHVLEDLDPYRSAVNVPPSRRERGALGISVMQLGQTHLYFETIYDDCYVGIQAAPQDAQLRMVSAHEAAHCFGIGDGPRWGSLMRGDLFLPEGAENASLSPRALRAIIKHDMPRSLGFDREF